MNIFNEILDFFRTGTRNSMARFGSWLGYIAAFLITLAAIFLALKSKLSYDFVALAAITWAAAHGGKTWAKSVELKNKENETIKEPESSGSNEEQYSSATRD